MIIATQSQLAGVCLTRRFYVIECDMGGCLTFMYSTQCGDEGKRCGDFWLCFQVFKCNTYRYIVLVLYLFQQMRQRLNTNATVPLSGVTGSLELSGQWGQQDGLVTESPLASRHLLEIQWLSRYPWPQLK